MSKQHNYDLDKLSNANLAHGNKALEMIMRDVIDGMENIANLAGYSPQPGSSFEILEIVADDSASASQPQDKASAEIIPINVKS